MQKKIISFKAVSVLTAAVLLFASCGRSAEEKAANQIIVFNYGDYIDRDILGQFEEETGIKVVYEEFLTPEAMYTKYKNSTVKYDLVCCSDYMVDKMIKDKEVKEIDYASMEHIGNIGDTYWKISESFDPGHKYTVPYFWGTVGILYNTTMMDKVPDSWNDLWDKQYKNNIIMQNSVRDSFVPPLVLDGCSINTKDEASLRKALDALEEQKDLVQSYLVDEVRDDMVNEQAAMAVIYSGEASLASEYNEDLEYIVPKEGTNMWMDSWIIPESGRNYNGAVKFLDFLCREDIAQKNFDYVYYSTPNEAVLDGIDEEEKEEDTAIFPEDDVLERCEMFTYLGPETEELYNRLWKELKVY